MVVFTGSLTLGGCINLKKRFKMLFLVSTLITILTLFIIYIAFDRYFNDVYKLNTELSLLESKKDFLKFTVENQIVRIENAIVSERECLRKRSDEISLTLQVNPPVGRQAVIDFCKRYFENGIHNQAWEFLVWDKKTAEALYDPLGLIKEGNAPDELERKKDNFAIYEIKDFGSTMLFFGARNDVVDQRVKKKIAAEIHNSEFPLDTYIWVNEVVNYEGGDGYAIRRVHPNLIDTEGMLLSTKMEDIRGNTPYLTELEGIKKDGEIFFTYFFKKKAEDRIAEKLTYAKLYKRYDWIVAFGTHLEDMAKYVDRTEQESRGIIKKLALIIAALIAGLILISQLLSVYLENRYHMQSKEELEKKLSTDPITGAMTRRVAEQFLEQEFRIFKKDGKSQTAFVMGDIDNLKGVNDTYGHEAGDEMIKNIFDTIKSSIRKEDIIFRWGGDEFVIICRDMTVENALPFCSKLLDTVKNSEVNHEGNIIKTTVSLGISYFRSEDKEGNDVIDRADKAMYRAKQDGKNHVEMEL